MEDEPRYLPARKLDHDQYGEDELDDDEEEQEEDDDYEDPEDDDNEGEEDRIDAHPLDLRPADLLQTDRNRPPFASRSPLKAYGSVFGGSAALSLSRTDAARAPVKASEQEKQQKDEWDEGSTLVLLQAWGNKFLELGRRSLRRKDWTQVAEQLARSGKIFKTDIQCRNRVDTLKKKYKREKHKQADIGASCSKWPYYKHLDALLNTVPRGIGLPFAVDAGQIIRMDQHFPPSNANFPSTSCEQRNGSYMSESSPNISEDEQECRTSTKRKSTESSFRSLAKAVKRFGEIYERMESAKRQRLLDLEMSRMEFTRDLELKKMKLLMQTQMDLAKMQQGTNDMDTGNISC